MSPDAGAEQWAEALTLDMDRTGRSVAEMIEFGRVHGQLAGVTLDMDHPNADSSKGIVASQGGWIAAYDSNTRRWTAR